MQILFFVVGLVVGFLFSFLFFRKKPIGTLQMIEDSEDGQIYLSLSLDDPVEYLKNKKSVNMKIRNINNDYYGETIN